MADREVLRWGVVGLGVGNQHALSLLKDSSSRLVAVCDIDEEARTRAVGTYGSVQVYADAPSMVDNEQLDALCVASYDWDHAATVVDALDKGLHVFAEKPLGTSAEDYAAICQALRRRPSTRLTTNTLLRRSPRFAWLKSQVEAGLLGSIFHIEADYLYGRLPKLTRGWRGTRADYSVTLGGAIHMVDLVMWLMSDRPASVLAIGSDAGIRLSSENEVSTFAGDSLRCGFLRFPNGATAKISANYAAIGAHFHRLDVFGTKGTFVNVPAGSDTPDAAATSSGLLLRGPDPGTVERVTAPYPHVPKGVLIPEFTQAIITGGDAPITEQAALDALAVCLAMDESVATVRVAYEAVPPRR